VAKHGQESGTSTRVNLKFKILNLKFELNFKMTKLLNYNLEERTTKFSGEIISFVRVLQKDIVNNPLISQLVRSGTSIGANYCEANGASSKKDFKNKIYICKKE
jgi:hypothetical protein